MLIPIIVLALFILVISLLLGSESPITMWLVNGFAVFIAALYYGIQKYQYMEKVARLRLLEIKKLEQTLAAIADTHWEWDLNSDAYDYHGSLASILGYTNNERDKAFWKEVIHPVDRPMHKYRLIRHLEDESVPFYSEYRLKNRNGLYRWFAARGQVVQRDANRNPTLMVGGLENIQQRKDLEKNLIHAHKMEAIGQLTGGIAHDFNNILASVLGYTELAQETRNPVKISSYLEQIHHGGIRARNIVRQLLDFSRGARSETEIVNLESELDNSIMMLRSTLPSSIEIVEIYPKEPCFTRLDPDQFQRVLLNLCINARDAMEGSGKLTIKLETRNINDGSCISCQSTINGDYHSITVKDNGEGIPVENLERLFDPFFTTKQIGKGSGLGLSVVHGIAHEFNGHLEIESGTGSGTSVSLHLPALCKQLAQSLASDPEPNDNKLNINVLVVDDESSVAALIREVLRTQGANVSLKTSAIEALAQLREIEENAIEERGVKASEIEGANKHDKFDLIISDQIMPSMSGIELAAQVMKINPTLPFILCSGSIIKQEDCPANVERILQKPINNQHLLEVVAGIFTQP